MNKAGSAKRWMHAVFAGGALLASTVALAQPPEGNSAIGPPQLRDFQLEPRERLVTQPRPTQPQTPAAPARTEQRRPGATPAVPVAPRPQPRPEQSAPRPVAPSAGPATRAPIAPSTVEPLADTPPPAIDVPADVPALPLDTAAPVPPPIAPVDLPPSAPAAPDGPPLWVFFLAAAVLGLLGYGWWQRRQAVERQLLAGSAVAVRAPSVDRPARPAPLPRPWLDVDIVPERATTNPDESVVEFEMLVRNTGGSPAKGVKLQAKFLCSTPTQDKDLETFFKLRPGNGTEQRTIAIPDLEPNEELRVRGKVPIKTDDIRALRVEERLVLIPIVAVNAFYGWGAARTGQTSRSFIVGREQDAEKMAPLRLDLGPRVHRNLGRRLYRAERRV